MRSSSRALEIPYSKKKCKTEFLLVNVFFPVLLCEFCAKIVVAFKSGDLFQINLDLPLFASLRLKFSFAFRLCFLVDCIQNLDGECWDSFCCDLLSDCVL